ncbi:MAG: GMC family oxidoreductase [Anaerolineae bacterium]|nr:GMC family oxidoreductase [Anaerolineae bacterium]
MTYQQEFDYDYIVIGSGFGGSVAALRLAEKGYRVLVIEKGKWLAAEDFPRSNWNLKRWLWLPALRFFGLFKITFFRHVTVLSGVGVGGGSLVYANTLAMPEPEFFRAGTWAHLADWQTELQVFYQTALTMLGTTPNPCLQLGDSVLQQLARQIGRVDGFAPTNVAVYFGEPDVTVADPYFAGRGPERTGCTFCGGCMLGCRYNAKNTLDKNYLHLAQQYGAKIQAEAEVYDVEPLNVDGSAGYAVCWWASTSRFKRTGRVTGRGIVFAGGVLGTVKLLLALQQTSLPNLSPQVGRYVRTNSESLLGVTALDKETVFSDGIAIGSILHTDQNSHLEPVRYPAGSGFWRLLQVPLVHGNNIFTRISKLWVDLVKHPIKNMKVILVDDWAKRTQILLYMQTVDGYLSLSKGWCGWKSAVSDGASPTAFIPEAKELAEQFAHVVNGKPTALLTETLFGIPTTAHILGGAVMGETVAEGVIDKDNRVFGYENMYICDGSMISANPGVNPALTIVALTERAMSKIKSKN